MKRIEFPALKIEIDVGDNVNYRDLGVVPNYWDTIINCNIEARVKRYAYVPFEKRSASARKPVPLTQSTEKDVVLLAPKGGCLSYIHGDVPMSSEEAVRTGRGRLFLRTFVEQGLPKETTTFAQGHEQTHALLKLKRIDALQTALDHLSHSGEKLIDDPSSLSGLTKEAICDVGGFYSLTRHYNQNPIVLNGYQHVQSSQLAAKWLQERSDGRLHLGATSSPRIFLFGLANKSKS